MRVLFIFSVDDAQSTLRPLGAWSGIQFGISYISSVLKAHNHQTRLTVLGSNRRQQSRQLLKSCVDEFNPNLICLTAVFSQYFFIAEMAEFIKSLWPDKFIIIGGVHATLNPNKVIQGPFDALCIGEGEYPTLELCDQLEAEKHTPAKIPNLWIKSNNGQIEKNEPRNFIQNISTLPFPDREMWVPWIEEQINAEFSVLMGRGCPYNCTYCSNHALKKIAGGKYVRMRSPENIVDEIALLHVNYPRSKVYLEVETIASDKAWTLSLCRHLEILNSRIDNSISYGCNFRISPQSIDENLFIAFNKANFYKINIGLESGSERIRREVLKRNYSNDDFMNVVSLARKHGLKVYLYNIIGLPGETVSDHMETVRLNRHCQPDGHGTGIFFPYPGTALYDTCLKQGLIDDFAMVPQVFRDRKTAVVELPNFSKKQIQHAYTWFNYNVYKGYRPLWRLLIQVAVLKIRAIPTCYFVYRKICQWPVFRRVHRRLAQNN